MTIPIRAAALMAKVLAACGDGEWRTVNTIAERTRSVSRIRKGRDQEHQTPAAGDG
jgi:hypothetical protein